MTAQCVGTFNGASFMVKGERDSASHVGNDECLLFVFYAVFTTVSFGNLPLVQGVPDGLMRHLRQTRNAGYIIKFIHHTGVNGEGTTAWNLLGQTQGEQRPKVTGMVHTGMTGVFNHLVVQFIHTALNRLHQTTAAHHHIEVKLVSVPFQLLNKLLPTIGELIHDERVLTQFVEGVVNGGMPL